GVDRLQGLVDLVGGGGFVQVAQHQHRGLQQSGGVGNILAGNIRSRSMHRLEDGALEAEVGAGNKAETADEARAQVADDVAVEVFEQQRVVLEWVHDQLHAGVVDQVLAISDVR